MKAKKKLYAGYSLESLLFIFTTFSIAGWLWEVLLHFCMGDAFVNRGMLKGPWLPIYGTCGIAMVLILSRLTGKIRIMLCAILLSGVIEYLTSYIAEQIWHVRWWDYSTRFLNLNGRVWLLSLVVFGVAGMAAVVWMAPFLNRKFGQMPVLWKKLLGTFIPLLFIADFIYSLCVPSMGKGITFIANL